MAREHATILNQDSLDLLAGVGGSALLTRVSMPALRSVGGRIDTINIPVLTRADIYGNPRLKQLSLGPAFYYSGIKINGSDLNSLSGFANGMYSGGIRFTDNPRLCAAAINGFAATVTFENGTGVTHNATC